MALFHKITEGKAECYVPIENNVSKDLPVFYNPIMEYNRTMTIKVVNALKRKKMLIALPLAGTSVRAMRLFAETPKGTIQRIDVNDHSTDATKLIRRNVKINNIAKGSIVVHCTDANEFLMTQETGYDYIDIDPFGSPNPFLNSAITRLKRDGILAITATDTASLCGTCINPCIRKYWARPLHTEEMHEVGLRILIRKVQLVGMQFDRALLPILSYAKDHYMRIFFKSMKSKEECNAIAKQHSTYKGAGPLWTGKLRDEEFATKISADDIFTKLVTSELDILGFYELTTIYHREKIGEGRPMDEIIADIQKAGFNATRTHFAPQGIKTKMPYEELVKILTKNSRKNKI